MVTVGQLVAGRYRVLHPLADGGMSRVWLARDELEDSPVALKKCTLPAGLTPDEEDVFRVWTAREARSFTLVDHPNVVRTLDVLHDDDAPWIVLEFVPSHSLQQVLDESGPLPPARVAGIGLAVLEGLLAVRRAGLLHLDVKPSNVLIATDGRVMLSDFGPAVTSEGVRALAGIVLGSPEYLAPERLLDGIALPESDLWSLGATLYHAVQGRPPFVRATTAETLQAVSELTPEPPARAGPLTEVIVALLSRNPADRPEPPMVEHALRAVTGQPAGRPELPPAKAPARADDKPGRGRRRLAMIAALVGVLGVLVAVVALLHPDDEAGIPASAASAAPPGGWYWYSSPGGSRVMLPNELAASGDVTAGGRLDQPQLDIEAGDLGGRTLLGTLAEAESAIRAAGGYRRFRLSANPDGTADWEYQYSNSLLGGELHGIQRILLANGKFYRIRWEVPVATWAVELPRFHTIVESFQPPPGS
ncbi:hypothetical protein GCM10010172_33340 [Paractinoplanes ferrugineus]|uniref:non-specific serine/threonine protein kinase n=1 Tax=Paractinoplanes ferrugineus TaxID=113564 RepID=A0A919J6F7_9ACTN|nr:serine/threonine-protein kinase [Actinoplanes ferrugineus]GIE14735.1 hypothetical protein Afe05nite_65750 [Actinoplanes ferrugineus]